MARKLVKFSKGYSRYNRGETAAFDEGMAQSLTEGKGKVGVIVGDAEDPNADMSVVIGKLDASEAQEFLAKARTEFEGRELSLQVRANSLEQKSRDLADREMALDAREAAAATGEPKVGPAPTEQEKTSEEPKGNGEPPKQGAKKPGA